MFRCDAGARLLQLLGLRGGEPAAIDEPFQHHAHAEFRRRCGVKLLQSGDIGLGQHPVTLERRNELGYGKHRATFPLPSRG